MFISRPSETVHSLCSVANVAVGISLTIRGCYYHTALEAIWTDESNQRNHSKSAPASWLMWQWCNVAVAERRHLQRCGPAVGCVASANVTLQSAGAPHAEHEIVRRSQNVSTPRCPDGEEALPGYSAWIKQRICGNSEDQRSPGCDDPMSEQKPAGLCFWLQDHRKINFSQSMKYLFYLLRIAQWGSLICQNL